MYKRQPEDSGITGLDVYNTAIEYQGVDAKGPLTLENDGTKTPRYQIGIANKDGVKPFPNDSLNKDTVFSKGEVITRNKLEELFMDETVNYLERPQIQYMNRLFNSTTGDNAYNANYTLNAVWVLKPGKSADSVQPEDFFIFPVPYLIQKGTIPTTEGGTLRHNPSRIRFTNNPKTIAYIAEETKKQVDSTRVEVPDDSKSIAAKTKSLIYTIDGQQYEDYEWYILIQEDSVIRFVFDPTNQDDYINANGVNFYDYDISEGNKKFDSDEMVKDVTGTTTYTIPADATVMYTDEKGINDPANYADDTANDTADKPKPAKLAFGNVNTGTGLGNLLWTDSKDKKNLLNGANVAKYGGAGGDNVQATFGLAQGLNTDNTIRWSSGVNAPKLFGNDKNNPEDEGYVKGKTSFLNTKKNGEEIAKTDEFYSLQFKRKGGTYTLSKVLKQESKTDPASQDLDKFQVTYKYDNGTLLWSNEFWPMDAASTYGEIGHDINFGNIEEKTKSYYIGKTLTKDMDDYARSDKDKILEMGGGVGALPATDISGLNDITLNENVTSQNKGKIEHNSYFGMSFTADFILDPGYTAPLRYAFYGDDDMFVFLSELDEYGNIIADKTDSEGNVVTPHTWKIADIGGVHSSIGMYVDLWDYVTNYEGKHAPIPYYKTDGNGKIEVDEKGNKIVNEPKHYRLTFFYTERGASGSSCYMRFSIPFQSLGTLARTYPGELEIQKSIPSDENTLYTFGLNLYDENGTNSEGSPKERINRYEYTFYKNGREVKLYDYSNSMKPSSDTQDGDSIGTGPTQIDQPYYVDTSTDEKIDYVENWSWTDDRILPAYLGNNETITLKDGEKVVIHNIPTGTLYKVTEHDKNGTITAFTNKKIGEDEIHSQATFAEN